LSAKEGNKALRNFNISVMVMPDFWEAYEKKRPYPLVNPRNNEVVRSVNPQVLFDRLVYQAWESAEPGVLFHDRINEYNPFLKSLGPINSTNPCITGDSLVSTDRGLEKISDLRAESGLTIDNRAVRQAKTDLVKVGGKDARVLGRYDKEKTLISRGTSVGVADNVFPTGVKETHKLGNQSRL
ncbi:MAG: hypothetical protein M1153_02785, partial [Patescibacteria group bacterium]|nr:hypothetical protein [Patescibacteria group bacterium]